MSKKLLSVAAIGVLATRAAIAQESAVTSAAGGAVVGAIVGGPAGAAVGGAVGAVAGIAIGPPPETVIVQPIPEEPRYAYAFVNEQRVIVEPSSRTVI